MSAEAEPVPNFLLPKKRKFFRQGEKEIFHAELLKDEPAWQARAQKQAAKMHEISQFLVDILKFDKEGLGEINTTLAMHDPCHMSRGVKVTSQPRQILQSIPGLKMVEMKEPARCCGAGGSFCVAHYDVARN